MGSEARTRVALLALLAVTLFSFTLVFAEGDYPGPALLGVLMAAGLAMGARRFGVGTLGTLLVSSAALLWYVAFLFETDRTLYGLPTLEAFERLGRSITQAVDASQVDYAPVPVRPGYVALLVSGMWAAATVGELATFRWKRPLLGALPCVALFALTTTVGTGAGAPMYMVVFLAALLTFWGLESSHRLRSWGRWVATWPGHEDEEPEAITGSMARRMGAGCIAVALVAPIFLPALEDGLLAWRNTTGEGLGAGGGGGGGARIDPLVSIAPTLVNQSSQELFTVQTDVASYYRLVSLPRFNGETWEPVESQLQGIEDGPVAVQSPFVPPPEGASSDIIHTIEISGLRGRFVPAAVQPRDVQLFGEPDRTGDLRYQLGSGDLRIDGSLNEGLTYRVRSVRADAEFDELTRAQPGIAVPLYTDLATDLDPRVRDLRDRWIQGTTSAYERLVAIQDALHSGGYTYSLPAVDTQTGNQVASTDHLTTFLLETRTGYCQQFATAFAVLSRSLGYPTRVVVGFLPGEPTPSGDGQIVRGTDAHAWPEVYFEGYGWIAFEPTPRADSQRIASVPAYTVPEGGGPVGGGANPELGAGRGTADDPNRAVLDARALNDPGEGTLSALELQERIQGTEFGETDEEAVWERTFRLLALVLAAVAAVLFAAIPAVKQARIARTYRRAGSSPRALTVAAFHEFLLEAGELAGVRGAAESASAYARRIAGIKKLQDSDAVRLAAIYEAAEYAPVPPSADAAGDARRLARRIRATLWHKASWWERGARLFSPRSLTRRAEA